MSPPNGKDRKRHFVSSLAALNHTIPTIIRLGKKAGMTLTYPTVKLWYNRYLQGMGTQDAPRSGRPKTALSHQQQTSLKIQCKKVGFTTRKWSKKHGASRESTRRAGTVGLEIFC